MKPKSASQKRNHVAIRYELRQPILKALVEKHYQGGVLSLLSDAELADVADAMTTAMMHNEAVSISRKRSK